MGIRSRVDESEKSNRFFHQNHRQLKNEDPESGFDLNRFTVRLDYKKNRPLHNDQNYRIEVLM